MTVDHPDSKQTDTTIDALREGPGSWIGPYKLLQLIGEGGFGSVFMADQEQPVKRRVALKIIKLGMDTRQVVARFEQERQALSMMDHPNIARVLDAGATETGRPYFVIELVKGAPIAEYCDKNNLSIDQRLELFAQACGAVQHAHGKGLIHRDLKPNNILVGTQEGAPQVKIIDFGIAKAMSQKLTDKTLFTEHRQVIGTLQYMSPEQAEGSLDIDTRTDVYSLGVLLYELLTGSTPFDAKTLGDAMYGEIQRMIREVEPPRPSTRLGQSEDVLVAIAAHRRVEPKRLGGILRGELDWIVMKALEKDRARRYETANGLGQDIQRYLAGEAVLAAPPSAAYRLQKFVRRNRGVVTACAAVGAALLLGAVGFAWQAHRVGVERDAAVVARNDKEQARQQAQELAASESKQRVAAESSEARAAAINQFLLDMLGSADVRELGHDVKVSEALDSAAARVGTSFNDRPEVEAAIRHVLGKTYLSVGMIDKAAVQLDASRALDQKLYGEASIEFARDLNDQSELLRQRGELASAAETCKRAAEIALQIKGAEAELTLGAQTQYANILVQLHRETEAETILRNALATRTRVSGRENAKTLIAINSLAVLLHNTNRLDEAETLYREALDISTRTLGEDHPDTLTARMNLASILRSRGRIKEAEPMMAAAYAGIRRVFGESNTETAGAAWALGGLYQDQGRFKDALPLLEECVAIRTRAQGADTIGVAVAKKALSQTLNRLGEYDRAVAEQREVVRIRTTLFGAEARDTIDCRLDLANALSRTEAKAEGEAMLKDLLEVCPRKLGEDDGLTIIATNSYAVFLLGQERFADAEPYLRKALEAGRRAEGADHRDTVITQINFSYLLRKLGRLDEAESIGHDVCERCARVFGPNHLNTGVARADYGETLIALGRHDEAKTELVEAIAIKKGAQGATNPGFTGTALALAKLLIDTGHADEAEPVLRDVVAVDAKARGPKDRRTASAQIQLGHCLTALRRFADAETLLVEYHPILVEAKPENHEDVRTAERCMAELYTAWNVAEPDADRAAKAATWQAKVDASK